MISDAIRAIIGDTVLVVTNPSRDSDALAFTLRNGVTTWLSAIHTSLGWAELFHVTAAFEAASIEIAAQRGLFDMHIPAGVEGVSAGGMVGEVQPFRISYYINPPPDVLLERGDTTLTEFGHPLPCDSTPPSRQYNGTFF